MLHLNEKKILKTVYLRNFIQSEEIKILIIETKVPMYFSDTTFYAIK